MLGEMQIAANVVVVDDGSRDGSLTLLRQLEALYHQNGLRVLAFKTNRGLGQARNEILLNSNHRYVLFLDADNELIPANVPHFYRAITATSAAVAFGNLITLNNRESRTDLLSNDCFQRHMFRANYIDAFSLVDRLQVLDCGGFCTDLMKGEEDWELYLHLAAAGRRIVFVPLVLGIYHMLPNSMNEETRKRHEAAQANDPELRMCARVFNQLGTRESLPLNTEQLRYHPDVGYF
jgi:glycosyltransferase involved in cell wall biosynthesis